LYLKAYFGIEFMVAAINNRGGGVPYRDLHSRSPNERGNDSQSVCEQK
jgi:hypothetical protein